MTFLLGMIAGGLITFVVFAAFMAPRHWEWYHENVDLRSQLTVAVERAAHYQHLASPIEWGTAEQREAGIVKKAPPYQGINLEPGEAIDFTFDDIKNGGPR